MGPASVNTTESISKLLLQFTPSAAIMGAIEGVTLKSLPSAFRLLHFSFAPVPLAESKGLNPDSIEIFATTDQALDSTSGEALLSRLHELIPLREITVYVRRDTWFVDIPGYPLAYPFQVEQAPPTREAFLQSSTLVCGGLENPINSAAK